MELRVTAERQGKLLSLLRRELNMSSGLIRRLKFKNCFFVDGEPSHTDRIVQVGQVVTVIVREHADEAFTPEHTPIDVVYEDESLLAADKPAGVIVHPTFRRTTGTLLTQVMGYYERTGQTCAIHFVNRLDRDTCGVVLLAKNSHVHGLCYEMQLAGKFRKTYHAVCCGVPENEQGRIELPIGRVDGGSLLRRIDPDGAEAVTEYRVLETADGLSLVELHPITGRTHQLRLHCLAAGFPILGDPQYFTAESRARSAQYGFTVQQLCAVELSLPHPMTGAELTIRANRDVFLPKNG
ncbi:MAG: RluA family pseudouridine synthase [Oscillospiraceae bacterium]|nr:RluA family pseudouridine synthase [Oscillospiraceae bacterium]